MQEKIFSIRFLKQFYVFDVPYAIQDDLSLYGNNQSNFEASWLVR